MKILKLALCAATAAAGLGAVSVASAADAPTVAIAYNIGVSNEYIFRGISNSAGKPQFFGGADLSYGQFYAGVWTSNVEFGDAGLGGTATDQEVDLYGGFKPVVGPVTFDFGLIYYGYINDYKDYADYWEGKAAGSMAVGPGTVGLALYYSPEFPLYPDGGGKAVYGEINGSFPVGKASVSGALGYQDLDKNKAGGGVLNGYTTWNIGVTYPLTSKVSVDGRYWDTDSKAHDFYGTKQHAPFNAGSSFVATLKVTL
jgi:uncharacterized protein (TIGR02001 family)